MCASARYGERCRIVSKAATRAHKPHHVVVPRFLFYDWRVSFRGGMQFLDIFLSRIFLSRDKDTQLVTTESVRRHKLLSYLVPRSQYLVPRVIAESSC